MRTKRQVEAENEWLDSVAEPEIVDFYKAGTASERVYPNQSLAFTDDYEIFQDAMTRARIWHGICLHCKKRLSHPVRRELVLALQRKECDCLPLYTTTKPYVVDYNSPPPF